MGDTLFVTGMQRSGTTLLEALLSRHPDISLLSQPFPALFVEAKRAFLRTLGALDEPYPLSDLFLETRYEPGDFAGFLGGYALDDRRLLASFAAMEDYSGQYTRISRPALEAILPALSGQPFLTLVASLYRGLAGREAAVVGGKEVLCEEFAPALVARGTNTVLIVRDPRDVLASLNHGSGRQHAGRLKPTLFNLRNWRKSVAFVLALGGRAGFSWLRYEDLVSDPLARLDDVVRALGLAPFAVDPANDLRDPQGRAWRGNSSHSPHSGVSDSSVGAFRGQLPPEVVEFTEAACWPELQRLGYSTALDRADVRDRLLAFRDPYPLERPELASFLEAERSREEVRRFELLSEPETALTRPWFLLPGVQQRLIR